MTYKLITGRAGDRWTKDGHLVKDIDVPNGEKKLQRKECMFCDLHGDHKRMVNNMMVFICDNHYYSTTYGALVAQMRKEGINGTNEDTPIGSSTERSHSSAGYSQG